MAKNLKYVVEYIVSITQHKHYARFDNAHDAKLFYIALLEDAGDDEYFKAEFKVDGEM